MIYDLVLAVHVMACVLMILVVLLQTGRGAGLSVFGGGGDSLITTPTGSSFLKNFTTILACTFGFTSLFLTLLSTRAGLTSVTSRVRLPPPTEAPPVPGAPSSTPNQAAPIPGKAAPIPAQPQKK